MEEAMKPGNEMGRDAYADQRAMISRDGQVVIFDVGANVGNTVERYRELFAQAIIHAFEPDPKTCDRLRGRFNTDFHASPNNIAILPSPISSS